MIPKELEEMFSTITTPIIFATAGEKPHATPMNWFYLDNGVIWMSPVGGSSKIKNMKMNRDVCFATVDGMQKGGRGFIVWGRISRMETGFIALFKNFGIMRRALKLRSKMSLIAPRTLRATWMLHVHPDIYYYFGKPWRRYFTRISICRVEYWLEDGVKKKIDL